jgi:hypothetical protein
VQPGLQQTAETRVEATRPGRAIGTAVMTDASCSALLSGLGQAAADATLATGVADSTAGRYSLRRRQLLELKLMLLGRGRRSALQ